MRKVFSHNEIISDAQGFLQSFGIDLNHKCTPQYLVRVPTASRMSAISNENVQIPRQSTSTHLRAATQARQIWSRGLTNR